MQMVRYALKNVTHAMIDGPASVLTQHLYMTCNNFPASIAERRESWDAWRCSNGYFTLCCHLQKFTAFDLDEFVAGKSKSWTFWNCDPSEFPWSYAKDEYAYVLAGQFYVTYEGADLPSFSS